MLHIYILIEQALSNPNILYAGKTMTAGAWKTNDKGENWGV